MILISNPIFPFILTYQTNLYSKTHSKTMICTHLQTFTHTLHTFTNTLRYTTLVYEGDLGQHFCSTSNKNYVTSPRLKQIDKLLENMFICLFTTTQPTHSCLRKKNSFFLKDLLHSSMSISTLIFFV